jgi:hypothetical protein
VRHYLDKVMMSLFDKEATYDAGPAAWTSGAACSLLDFDDASAHEQWDDTIQSNVYVIAGNEFVSLTDLVRQSMRLQYQEPRVKPNTLAGLMGLPLGTVTATQDGVLTAYRHRITPINSVSIPSIGLQTLRDGSTQRKYTGVKSDGFTLSNNGPYFQFQTSLVGSGTRATAADAFTAAIAEAWLRWGDARIYIKDTAGTPISTVLATPSQTAANLGGSEVNLSTRVLTWNLQWQNNLVPEFGYRASTGMVRGNFHPVRRAATVTFNLEVDSATEATELNYYLLQSKLAMELTVNSGVLIAATGAFFFGFTIIVPRIQLSNVTRGETNQLENLSYVGVVEDDGTNPAMVAFVYNAQPVYLV